MRIAQHLDCMWFLSPWGWLGVKGVLMLSKQEEGNLQTPSLFRMFYIIDYSRIFWVTVFFLLLMRGYCVKAEGGKFADSLYFYIYYIADLVSRFSCLFVFFCLFFSELLGFLIRLWQGVRNSPTHSIIRIYCIVDLFFWVSVFTIFLDLWGFDARKNWKVCKITQSFVNFSGSVRYF